MLRFKDCFEHGCLPLLSIAVCSPAHGYEPPSSKLVPLEVDGLLVYGKSIQLLCCECGVQDRTLNHERATSDSW